MAKKVKMQGELNIDDKGDLKKLEKDAKAAGKGLDKTAKGAHSADRRLKGAAQASSSSTKNFSKMSQGISGGLVPAYATLAASLFAVDAAFQALKRASDLRVQRQGMQQYATATGIALQSITKDLQAATGHQLDFKEAAESTAIAVSAGFSADQITKIGTAARQASIALGRDFADSYQRMLKGITKAEPELLDELGIILRLEKATKIYAASIGKTAQELTAYERQQAVFNEVLDQTESKYGAIGDAVPVSVMGQLGAVFQDLSDSFLEKIAPIAEFFGNILVNNTNSAIAALGVFGASILKNVIPPIDAMVARLKTAGSAMATSGGQAWGSLKSIPQTWKKSYKTAFGTPQRGLSQARKIAGKVDAKGAGVESLRRGGGLTPQQLNHLKHTLKRAERQWKKHGAVISGNWKGVNIKMVNDMQLAVAQMEGRGASLVASLKIMFTSLGTTISAMWKTVAATFKVVAAGMRTVATGLGIAMNKALGIIGWIGMLVMAKDMFADMARNWDNILISIGEGIQKIGGMLENLGKKIPFIGGFFKLWGQGFDKAGAWVKDKGLLMQPGKEVEREYEALSKRNLEIATKTQGRKGEFQRTQLAWDLSTNEKFDRRAATTRMLATIGGGEEIKDYGLLSKEIAKKQVDYAYHEQYQADTAVNEAIEGYNRMQQKLEDSKKGTYDSFGNLIKGPEWKPTTDEEKALWEKGQLGQLGTMIDMDALYGKGHKGKFDKEREGYAELTKDRLPLAELKSYYLELAKVDEGYGEVAAHLDNEDWDKAADKVDELTRKYGSHVQAVKDMASAHEGRSRRLAEFAVQAQELTVTGIEVRNMARSLGELDASAFSLDNDLKSMFAQFPEQEDVIKNLMIELEDGTKRAATEAEKLAAAQDFVNKEFQYWLKLTRDLRDANEALAEAQYDVAAVSHGAAAFRGLATEQLNAAKAEQAYQQAKLQGADDKQTYEDIIKEGGKPEEIEAARAAIRIIELNIEAQRMSAETAQMLTTDVGKLGMAFKESFTDGLAKSFEQIITGTKSLSEAFKGMAKNILASLAKVIAKQLMLRALTAAFGGTNFGKFLGVTPKATAADTRYGGIQNPPGYRSYQDGGVASGPTSGYQATLHGTEAVVPLGNDRSIPVKMKGGAGSVTNTNVTVNVSGDGQTETDISGNSRGAAMGQLIANAIDERLQDEQRPGGMLNPGG